MELAQRIRANQAHAGIRLILMTSNPMRNDSINFFNQGFTGYLTKPYHVLDLIDMLALLLTEPQPGLLTRYNLKERRNGEAPKERRKIQFGNSNILVVEDNPINQQVATSLLARMGCHSTTAADGEEAIRLVRQNHFDLILMDCQMPVMDGYKATQIIRQIEVQQGLRHTPIVALTASAINGDGEKCLAAGMDAYLTKPLRTEELSQTLLAWLPQEKSLSDNSNASKSA